MLNFCIYPYACCLFNVLGLFDSKGLQIYAYSLWQLGKNDLVLSAVRTLASSVLSLEKTSVTGCISFICRLLYYVSGQESAIKSIIKMPKDLFQSSKVSFVVSAIHALDQRNQLDSVVSSSRCFLTSPEEITGMHFLIALGKLVSFAFHLFLKYNLNSVCCLLVFMLCLEKSKSNSFQFYRLNMDQKIALGFKME